MIGYKLFRKRKDGTYGPLFINRRQRLEHGVKYEYEDHPTKGFSHRPGWHVCSEPVAPHLSKKDRVWCMVRFKHLKTLQRPASQGGTWYLGSTLKIMGIRTTTSHSASVHWPLPMVRKKSAGVTLQKSVDGALQH